MRPLFRSPGPGQPNELILAVRAHRTALLGVALFSGVINLLYLAPSIYMLQVYDRVLASRSEFTLVVLTLLIIGLYALMAFLENFRSAVLIRVGNALDEVLSKRVFTAAFERNLRMGSGNAAQAMSDLTQLRQFATSNGLFAFLDAPWFPIYLIVIYFFHPWLGAFSLVAAILLAAMTVISDRSSKAPLAESNQAAIAANQYVNSNLRNAEVIEAMGMLPNLMRRWYQLQSKMLERQSFASDRAGTTVAVTKMIRLTLQSGILGFGAYLVLEGQATAGIMIAASILMGRALAPVELLIGSWKGFVGAKASYQRLVELLNEHPVREIGMPLPRPRGVLVAENVYVTPPRAQAAVLKGLNFSFGPGEIIGIIGPSASGKSTLARAMVGIWPAQVGKVRLDGVDIFQWNKFEVGPAIGYLPQDVELFDGSLAENICRFGDVDSEKVIAAAQACGLHDMILHFPKGYDTRIGEAGGALSGGQRQRIALARAIYDTPAFIVLDEPNSNLDDLGEAALVNAVLEMKRRGSTVVLITHRTSVLRAVDKLMLLRDGQVQMFGPRDEVLNALAQANQQLAQRQQQAAAVAGQKPDASGVDEQASSSPSENSES
jgi:ATP-binding cassette subfamily C exporter for protease/lipase